MFGRIDIQDQLADARRKHRKQEDLLLTEAKKILHRDLFAEKKILENLKQYNKSFELIDEEDIDATDIYTPQEIKNVAVAQRLKFLDSGLFKPEIPHEAVLKIKELDRRYGKELKAFKVLATHQNFLMSSRLGQCSLFVKTNYENYYLIHQWGEKLAWYRTIMYWPLRNFETLATTIFFFTLLLTMSLPTALITLDSHATYWSGYRAAAFFHLLIFDFGVTVYFTFAFALNFSSSIWNRLKDFD